MVKEITPVLPPGVADRFIELYLLAPMLALGTLYFVRRIVRDLRFSEDDIATRWVGEGSQEPVGPVINLILDVLVALLLGWVTVALIWYR
ncbi:MULTISPECIES: hypothetical protein [unclassified Rhizobium]|uniref:hypothetical protein n=1 Tax=unclassified Rhizobium TaxID=2613769 RepID=UPI000713B48D|nr:MULTISPECIES: hypothetical protein [unclassified Rhizobium]KQS90479.1 hypothetical protein ASG50_08550 [Rhizobium sp. Leaf386]KQS90618.1 hypothetical protein ASG42_08740 [Rhizobium sp. Leaf391]KQU10221.1 hypothetical protein ASG68_04420 [Rhizobium sp. Leaf453]